MNQLDARARCTHIMPVIPKVVAHRLEPAVSCVSFATFSRSAFSLAMRELMLSSIWPWKSPPDDDGDDDDGGGRFFWSEA